MRGRRCARAAARLVTAAAREQVAGHRGEGGQKLHWCRSNRWLVVRGGRSVLTLPVCGRRWQGDCALPCALRPVGAGGLTVGLHADTESTPGARRRTPPDL